MAAFIIANYNVTNPEAFSAYPPAATPTLAAYGAEVLAVDSATEVLEGQPGHVSVILKFPSKEAARTWYNSPDYQAVIHHRTGNSDGTMVLVDEFVMPS